jgi:hypothetical protein
MTKTCNHKGISIETSRKIACPIVPGTQLQSEAFSLLKGNQIMLLTKH